MVASRPERISNHVKASPRRAVVAVAVALALLLIALRYAILADQIKGSGLIETVSMVALAAQQDILVVLALTLVAVTLMPDRRRVKGRLRTVVVFFALASLLLIWGALNVVAVRLLGEPVNLAWLHYSDIANNTIVLRQALKAIGFGGLAMILALVLLLAGLAFLTAWAMRLSVVRQGVAVAASLVLVVGFLTDARSSPLSAGKRLNPMVALATSIINSGTQNPIAGLRDSGTEGQLGQLKDAPPLERPVSKPGAIKNVIIFALESTSFKYVDVPEMRFGLTPNIRAHAQNGITFPKGYVHTPASNYFLVSILGGLVPELSAYSMTYSYPDLAFETISDVLARNGFRTGFFNTSDNRFQGTEGFVSNEGFDTVLDHRDWPCKTGIYEFDNEDYDFLNTSNEHCSIDAITSWIERDTDRRFFVTFRTGMTHYPYFAGDDPQLYTDDPNLNRYMNAVRVADEAFGRLMGFLEETGRAEDTLIVIVGDHGESFGEHGNYVHAGGLYEPNIHVPFVLIHPGSFSGEVSDRLVGLSDVAPTIADLLDFEISDAWHGTSVFDRARKNAAFFFSPWNGFQVGFREGDFKLVYHANTGELTLFDLAEDPQELKNVAPDRPDTVERMRPLLAAWIAMHERRIANMVAGNPSNKPIRLAALAGSAVRIEATGISYQTSPRASVFLDGEKIGQLEVTAAPSTARRAVSESAIDAALTEFEFGLPPTTCPKSLDIYFENDEWAGDGLTGDTDIYVKRVELGGRVYRPNEFSLLTPSAGGLRGAYYGLWRNGGLRVSLDMAAECITMELESN